MTALPLLLFALASPSPVQDAPTAVQVMDAVYSTFGSPERLAAVKNRIYEGKMTFGEGEPGNVREAIGPKGQAHLKSDLPGFGTFEEGCGEGTLWEINPMTGGASVKSGPAAARSMRHYANLRYEPWRQVYEEVALEAAELGGKAVHRLTCKPWIHPSEKQEGAQIAPDVWYVDSESHRLLRADVTASMGSQPMVFEITYSDWKTVDGISYAHTRELKMMGMVMKTTIERIQHDVELPADEFRLPDAVREAKALAENGDGAGPDADEIVVETLEEQHAAVIRIQCKKEAMSQHLAVALPKVMMHLRSVGAEVTGAPFTRYHTFGDDIDFEAGLPVASAITAKGDIQPITLPGGPAVSAWHVGPYEELSRTHERIQAWLGKNEVETTGPCWEIYWTDPGLEPDPKKWRTQILWPCRTP